ncbi:hypothetical protein [Rubellimicrobium sp. CFH 75288]|uniref:hypothetical protein n=1 Tax=Rubellimicrobium sp. CFH 75288 TaxID=2697034 RepID=UPI001413785E|nr:hypothetical protein [Rubellimicrobium sp. CFH 75288]NAZ35297.1 hypothetical protein [Rubellimicrobium sp. CFH 75288]
MIRGGALLLALAPALAAAQEPALLDCATEGGEAFRVLLWQPSADGPLHCVEWLDLEDVAPCAPQGGWGLTDPDAPGVLASVATDSRVAAAHPGPKFFARVGPSEFVASASSGPGMPLALEVHGDTFWRLRMTLGGDGSIFTRTGERPFHCARR